MLPPLLWVLLGWPPFQLLNAGGKCKGWQATPFTFLWIGIHLSDSLLVDAQRYWAHARAFWLVRVLILFPFSAQTTFFMKPSYCQDCCSSARLGWTQPRGLKFIGKKNTHAYWSQARNWNLLSLAGVLHLEPAHNPIPPSCSPQSSFQPPRRRKHWKQDVTEGWSLLTVGSSGVMPQTASHSMVLVCIVSRFLSEIMHTQLHGKQKPVGGHREPHGFFCFANPVGESCWLLA